MIIFSAPSRGQQVLTPLGSEQTTSLLVVLIFSPGAPSRMGRARWREQGGGVPLGAGGIHFRRAGPIPTGVPKGPALWGEKEVRPESRSSRSPVLQALISLTQEIIFTASQYVFGRCFAENWMVLEL